MKGFAALFEALDSTTRTNEKVAAMERYFRTADPSDAAWAVHFLSGERPKRLVPVRRLAEWALDLAGLPSWLFEECYQSVGDLAETISLLLPPPDHASDLPLHVWAGERLLGMAGVPESEQRRVVTDAWRELGGTERFIWNKLITGGFRVGVSRSLVIRALAGASGLDEATIAHRMMGRREPTPEAFTNLMAEATTDADDSRPYPFFLAHALETDPVVLGARDDWLVEWKWDGIRAQIIRRRGRSYIWSRGEELVTDRFPELAAASVFLPNGTVLDGEIVAWANGVPLPFSALQRRIGRKKIGPRLLEEVPAAAIVYDLLEWDGRDVRPEPLRARRALLEALISKLPPSSPFVLSPAVTEPAWPAVTEARSAARERAAEGLMIKHRESAYGVGRRRGAWWKWKVDPFAVDAVLLYAQPGHGRRAALHTDYTFAVWKENELVPFAKAYSGLTDAEIHELDRWIRRNTVEKFGPVRAVPAEQVFEVAFEGIQPSPRHRSGIAVRFPRIARWRRDKQASEADRLETLHRLLQASRT